MSETSTRTPSNSRTRVLLVDAANRPLGRALLRALTDRPEVELAQAPEQPDWDELLADADVVVCPLEGEHNAVELLKRACARGVATSIVAYADSPSSDAVVSAWRAGLLDLLGPADVERAAERVTVCVGVSRRRAQTHVAIAELERYRRFFESGPVIIFRWRAQHGWPVEAVSPNVVQLFGTSADDFLSGRAAYAASVHPEDLERVAREVATNSSAGMRTFDQEYRIVRPDGEVRWLYDHTVVVRDEFGAVTHYEGYVFDVTQLEQERRTRTQAERKLYQAQKLESLGLLAGGVAHDFNNLLTTILGECSMALDTLAPPSPVHAALTNVVAAARSAAGLTRQMLAYAGKASSSPQACDLWATIHELRPLMESSLPKGVKLELDLGAASRVVYADPTHMQQVVMNLVLNGAEACAERGGLVRIGLSGVVAVLHGDERECVQIEVTDDGCGMDAATLSRVFEPFFSTKLRGRGLGLSAVRGLVDSHGGELRLTSQPGRGTTARVLLPVSKASAPPRAPLPTPHRARGERVLVVDDEDAVARVAARCLQHFGYSTAIVNDGQSALDALANSAAPIQAVLLDRTMPGLSGDETLSALRARFPQVAVLVTSGFDESDSVLATRAARADGFLRKPYTPDELARAIRTALEAARPPSPTGGENARLN